MSTRRNRLLGGGTGTALSGAWGLYSAFTTAKDLPTDAGWLAQMMADPPIYAPWLLFAVCAVFLAWVFWHRPTEPDEEKKDGPKTEGPQSPAIGSITGDAHFHYGPSHPPMAQERKQAVNPNRYSAKTMENLQRAILASAPANPHGLARFVSEPKPNLPLAGVLVRVYRMLGPVPQSNLEKATFWDKVNLTIADAVVHNDLHTWGRSGKRALLPIDRDDWEVGTFDHKSKSPLHVPGHYGLGYDLSDLHFWQNEIDRIWPEPPTVAIASLSGDPRPERDVSLAEALAYIELREWGKSYIDSFAGAVPAVDSFEDFRQRAFDGKVSTWGQATPNGVWKPIEKAFWENAWPKGLSLVKGEAHIENRAPNAETPAYWNVEVNRAEIEKEWPHG